MSEQQQHTTERIFNGHELGEPLGRHPCGMFVLGTDRNPDSQDLGRRWNKELRLVPAPAEALAEVGIHVAMTCSGTAAVALHCGGEADPIRLALVFGLHLNGLRARDPHPVRPCVTSDCPPILPGNHLVRLPHLIAVRASPQSIEDHALWEVMTADNAVAWLGGSLPEQEKRLLVEQNLPGLLALRSQARAGVLARSHQVMTLLTRRYLSIRMVYQHIDLFLGLLADATRDERV